MSTTTTGAPGLALLRRTPDIVAWLTEDLEESDLRWKPAPDRWCVLEVVNHLVEADGKSFRPRTERILAEDHPTLPSMDPDAAAANGGYLALSLAPALAKFRDERAASLRVLETVRAADLERTAYHPGLACTITLGNLLYEWPLHDLGHVKQIAELIRARKYHPYIGPWQEIYPMRP